MSTTRRAGRFLLPAILLAALLAAGWWYWQRGRTPESTVAQLLAVLPDGQAVVAYIDVPALRRAPTLGPWLDAKLAEQGDALPLAAGIRGVSMGVGADALYLATALDLSEAAAVSYLAQQRAGCTQPLDKQACTTASASGESLSMRLLADNLLAIAHSKDSSAAERFGGDKQPREWEVASAREALDGGALLWAGLDPRRLEEVMRNPPEGWVNLSLVAKALGPAENAAIAVHETTAGIVMELRADCSDEAGAAELRSVLAGLNKMAGALAASAGDGGSWVQAAASFQAVAEGATMKAVWTLPATVLQN